MSVSYQTSHTSLQVTLDRRLSESAICDNVQMQNGLNLALFDGLTDVRAQMIHLIVLRATSPSD